MDEADIVIMKLIIQKHYQIMHTGEGCGRAARKGPPKE
jgi:hypothetical protein